MFYEIWVIVAFLVILEASVAIPTRPGGLRKSKSGFRFTEIRDHHTQLQNWGFKIKSDNHLAYLVFSINIAGSSIPSLDFGS